MHLAIDDALMPSSKLISCAQLNESVCFPFYYKVFEMVEVVEKDKKVEVVKKKVIFELLNWKTAWLIVNQVIKEINIITLSSKLIFDLIKFDSTR